MIINNQLSDHSTQYFDQLLQKVNAMNNEIQQIDQFTQLREKKFQDGLKTYSHYLKKENDAFANNQKFAKLRNQWFLSEAKKSWANTVERRTLILRSLARTNIVKRDAEEWLSRMDDSLLEQSVRNEVEDSMSNSRLINKYNEIVNQYNMKLKS